RPQALTGLAQRELELLHLVLVATLILLALLLHRIPVMVECFAGVLVLFLQGLDAGVALGEPRSQSLGPLLELRDRHRLDLKLLSGLVVLCLLALQRDFGSLELAAQSRNFLLL